MCKLSREEFDEIYESYDDIRVACTSDGVGSGLRQEFLEPTAQQIERMKSTRDKIDGIFGLNNI